MINLFKKIRQRLVQENRFTRYLLYAIGEIFLVVIGILIALQINNWNEEQKLISKERELLIYVLENIKTDSISIDSIITRTDRILRTHKNLIKLSNNEIKDTQVGNLDLLRASEPNQTITKKNNPNLPNEVRSQHLKKIILDYYLALDWLEFTITTNNDLIEQRVRPFMAEKGLLNYGNQFKVMDSPGELDLVRDDKFLEEFQNEEIRQVLFESGIKLGIMKMNAIRTSEKNNKVKQAILSYLN